MAESIKLPIIRAFSEVTEDWEKFKQKFQFYLIASNKNDASDDVKIALMMTVLGDEGIKIYNTIPNQADKQSFNKVEAYFQENCIPKRNVTVEAFKFNNMKQREGQTIDNFITEIRNQAANCNFTCSKGTCKAEYVDRMIRDKLVIGVSNKDLQSKLLQENDANSNKLIDICKSYELSVNHQQLLNAEIDAIKINKKSNKNVPAEFQCKKCGYSHKKSKCPAYGKRCMKCSQFNHFSSMCQSKFNNSSKSSQSNNQSNNNATINQPSPMVREVSANEDNVSHDNENAGTFKIFEPIVFKIRNVDNINFTRSWIQAVLVENVIVDFKLDSGADISIIPINIINEILKLTPNIKNNINHSPVVLYAYGNHKIPTKGLIKLKCKVNNETAFINFVIVEGSCFKPILSLAACLELNLILRVHELNLVQYPKDKKEFLKKNKQYFEGCGKIPGFQKIHLRENSIAKINYKKRVPIALQERLKITLNDLVVNKIIVEVNHPTEWVNNMMIVEKPNGDLRICLDPKPLNECIQREHYIIPTTEDILSRIAEKTVFSVIDLKNGFWQLQLDNDSSNLTTFSTPFGRYKFLRLPFGLNCAPELFQKKMVEIFGDIMGVEIYFDDLIISGHDEAEHDRALNEVLKRANKYNVKFNPEKLQYKSDCVKFMGHQITKEGINPDPKHVQAINHMPVPKNKQELLRFLGIAKFLCKFIPNLTAISFNLRELTKPKTEWQWSQIHKKEYGHIKDLISSAPILKPFNPNTATVIQTDASQHGLGCVLIQSGHPISYASRSLTKSEINYSQIEKELLAIVFATERFHQYVYGIKDLTVHTDHKPLLNIINRELNKISPRLQRMILKLLRYNIKVHFVPGKDLLIADALSRAYIDHHGEPDIEMQFIINSIIVNHLCMPDSKKRIYQNATKEDKTLQLVMQYTSSKWPDNKKLINSDLKHFNKIKDEININEDLLFFNHKLIVPESLKQNVLRMLHDSHAGIEKTKLRARQLIFWPGFLKDVENYIANCKVCLKFSKSNQKEPIINHESPKCAWDRISLDICEFGNKNYLILIDAYSNWIEILPIQNKSIHSVIYVLKKIFTTFGIPNNILADNNPFNSYEFKEFADAYNINIHFSSPYHHQSNGLAEKAVSIAKKILRTSHESGVNDFSLALLEYRNMPIAQFGLSPAQLFFGRQLKTMLPVTLQSLQPVYYDPATIEMKRGNKKNQQNTYYNKNAKILPELKENDYVLVRTQNIKNNTWIPAKVLSKMQHRKYKIILENGQILIRNRKYLKHTSINKTGTDNSLLNDTNITSHDSENFPIALYDDIEPNRNENAFEFIDCRTEVQCDDEISDSSNENSNNYEEFVDADLTDPNGSLTAEQNDQLQSSNEGLNHFNETENIEPFPRIQTRSGRIVRQPNYLNNYETY